MPNISEKEEEKKDKKSNDRIMAWKYWLNIGFDFQLPAWVFYENMLQIFGRIHPWKSTYKKDCPKAYRYYRTW